VHWRIGANQSEPRAIGYYRLLSRIITSGVKKVPNTLSFANTTTDKMATRHFMPYGRDIITTGGVAGRLWSPFVVISRDIPPGRGGHS